MNNITFPDFPTDLTQQIVPPDQYVAGGGFADIYCCPYNPPGRLVAVKAFRPTSFQSIPLVSTIFRQLEIQRRLDHPNILPLLGITTGFGPSIAFVSPWMTNGTLHEFLLQNDATMTTEFRLKLLVDISNGLEYLHSLPIIHGNLTTHNILIGENNNAYLSGFTLSTVPERIAEQFPHLRQDSNAGTIRFMAPELLEEQSSLIGTAIDVFSLGCNGFFVLSGQMPWAECPADHAVLSNVSRGKTPARPSSRPIDDHHWMFLESCWSSVQNRPSASSAFHTFYKFLTAPGT